MLRLSPMQTKFFASLAVMALVNGVWAYLWADAVFVKNYGVKDFAFYAYTLLFATFFLWSLASLRSAVADLQKKSPSKAKSSHTPTFHKRK